MKRHLKMLVLFLLPLFASGVYAQNIAKGARIYNLHCASCHGPRGQPPAGSDAPELMRAGKLNQPDMMLMQVIKTGRRGQPPFLGILSDQDITDALAYARTLR